MAIKCGFSIIMDKSGLRGRIRAAPIKACRQRHQLFHVGRRSKFSKLFHTVHQLCKSPPPSTINDTKLNSDYLHSHCARAPGLEHQRPITLSHLNSNHSRESCNRNVPRARTCRACLRKKVRITANRPQSTTQPNLSTFASPLPRRTARNQLPFNLHSRCSPSPSSALPPAAAPCAPSPSARLLLPLWLAPSRPPPSTSAPRSPAAASTLRRPLRSSVPGSRRSLTVSRTSLSFSATSTTPSPTISSPPPPSSLLPSRLLGGSTTLPPPSVFSRASRPRSRTRASTSSTSRSSSPCGRSSACRSRRTCTPRRNKRIRRFEERR